MVGVVVTGHGGFAAGMAANVKMLAGSDAELKAVDFADGMDVEVFEKQLAEAMEAKLTAELIREPGGGKGEIIPKLRFTLEMKKSRKIYAKGIKINRVLQYFRL